MGEGATRFKEVSWWCVQRWKGFIVYLRLLLLLLVECVKNERVGRKESGSTFSFLCRHRQERCSVIYNKR